MLPTHIRGGQILESNFRFCGGPHSRAIQAEVRLPLLYQSQQSSSVGINIYMCLCVSAKTTDRSCPFCNKIVPIK